MHIADQGIFFYQDGGIKVTLLLCELIKFPRGGGGVWTPLEKTSVMVV